MVNGKKGRNRQDPTWNLKASDCVLEMADWSSVSEVTYLLIPVLKYQLPYSLEQKVLRNKERYAS